MPPSPALGEFEQILLLAILRLGQSAYGVTIRQEIADCTRRTVTPGALYTTVARLEQKGMIAARTGDPTPERGGRAKRYLHVTKRGIAALTAAQLAYRSLLHGLNLLPGEPS